MDSERSHHYPLRRRAVVKALLEQRGDMLVVAGLGASAWDMTAAGDSPLNFPLWGAMGGAVPVGLVWRWRNHRGGFWLSLVMARC